MVYLISGEVIHLKCTTNSEQNVVVPVEGPSYQFGLWQIGQFLKRSYILKNLTKADCSIFTQSSLLVACHVLSPLILPP